MSTTQPGPADRYRAFVEAATAVVEGAQSLPVTDLQPFSGSMAEADIRGQAAFDTPTSSEHILHAHDEGRLLCTASADHLRQFLRAVFTEPPALFAHFGIARDGITAAGLSIWLVDRSVDLETRIKRMQALRRKNASEMKKVKRGDTATVAARIEAEVGSLCSHHRWTVATRDGGVGGEAVPTMKLIFDIAIGQNFGTTDSAEVVYRYTSGIVHAFTWALRQSTLPGPAGTAGLPSQRLVVDYDTALSFGTPLLLSTFRAIDNQRAYFGWDATPEWQAAAAAFADYDAVLKKSKPASP